MYELDNDLDEIGKDSIANLFSFVNELYEEARMKSKEDPVEHFMATRIIVEVSQAIHLYAQKRKCDAEISGTEKQLHRKNR